MLKCESCKHSKFKSTDAACNHIRNNHSVSINYKNTEDAHGHIGYCFDCTSRTYHGIKSHRSFDSSKALFSHVHSNHGIKISRQK